MALADADWETRMDAITIGAEVTGWSGTILDRPFTDVQPGHITTGQCVLEYHNGQQIHRYVTQRTHRGHVVWCAMVPGPSVGQQVPAGTFSDETAAMDHCQEQSAAGPLDFILDEATGVFRGSAAGRPGLGRWTVFPSLVDVR